MQQNPLKGEVRFKVGEDEYVLAYPINSIIAAEDHFQKPFAEIRKAFLTQGDMGLKEVRTFVRFGLFARHPKLTDEEVGEIIGCVGDREFGLLMGECFIATFGGPGTGATAIEPGGATASEASPSS
jgi:hypothetical protein